MFCGLLDFKVHSIIGPDHELLEKIVFEDHLEKFYLLSLIGKQINGIAITTDYWKSRKGLTMD